MTSKVEKWAKFTEEREQKELPFVPYKKWLKDHYGNALVSSSIKYLDLDRAGPNWGTKNKQELTKRTLHYISDWGTGPKNEWISKLSNRLGLSPRTVLENYIDPLIKERIIKDTRSQLHFVGPPEDDDYEDNDGVGDQV